MGIVVAIANQKGGVGKTTVTANLGAALTRKGQQVLLIDIDPQACLSLSFGIENPPSSIGPLLTNETDRCEPHLLEEGMALIPADDNLAMAEIAIAQTSQPESRLRDAVGELKGEYDFVLIDCPPTIGLLTTNALVAADFLLIPVCSEYLALRGLRRILGVYEGIRERLNPDLKLLGVLIAIFDNRSRMSEQIQEVLGERFGELLFKTVIRQSAWAMRAPAHERTILSIAPHSGIAQDYMDLAAEVMRRVKKAGAGKSS